MIYGCETGEGMTAAVCKKTGNIPRRFQIRRHHQLPAYTKYGRKTYSLAIRIFRIYAKIRHLPISKRSDERKEPFFCRKCFLRGHGPQAAVEKGLMGPQSNSLTKSPQVLQFM